MEFASDYRRYFDVARRNVGDKVRASVRKWGKTDDLKMVDRWVAVAQRMGCLRVR
jgi:hypothetical protein